MKKTYYLVMNKTISRNLAGFLYTPYLLHLPLLVFIKACLLHSIRWQPNVTHFFFGAMICAIVLIYAFVISRRSLKLLESENTTTDTKIATPVLRSDTWFQQVAALKVSTDSPKDNVCLADFVYPTTKVADSVAERHRCSD